MPDYADGNFIHDTHWLDLLRGLRGNGIVSGCNVDLTGIVPANREVKLHLGTYYINKTFVNRAADVTIIITAGDVTDPRWDLIVVSAGGGFTYLQGTPSPMPSPPDLPANSLMCAMIYVPAGWTGPTSLSYIYDFGMGSTWLASHVNAIAPHSGHEATANKNAANGYAGLTAAGKLITDSVITASITAANVTDAKISNRTALSVMGRSTNSAGVPADIAATVDGQVLRRISSVLGFGTIGDSSITPLGIGSASLAAKCITNGKLRDSVKASVIGRQDNTDGQPADILGTTAGTALIVSSGPQLSFGMPDGAIQSGGYILVGVIDVPIFDNRTVFGTTPQFNTNSTAFIDAGPQIYIDQTSHAFRIAALQGGNDGYLYFDAHFLIAENTTLYSATATLKLDGVDGAGTSVNTTTYYDRREQFAGVGIGTNHTLIARLKSGSAGYQAYICKCTVLVYIKKA